MSRSCFAVLIAGLIALAIVRTNANTWPAEPRRASGIIRGRVELRQSPAENAPRVSVSDLGMGTVHEPPDRRSVVYLDPAPRAAFDTREEPRPRMDQRDETFEPPSR